MQNTGKRLLLTIKFQVFQINLGRFERKINIIKDGIPKSFWYDQKIFYLRKFSTNKLKKTRLEDLIDFKKKKKKIRT